MTIDLTAGATAGTRDLDSLTLKAKDSPDKILNAAKQFESLLVSQLMKSMQDNEGGWLGTEDQSASAAMEYGQEAFAQAMSAQGGLGLAKMVADGLQRAAKE
jgi:Rod binding domain-containing protein